MTGRTLRGLGAGGSSRLQPHMTDARARRLRSSIRSSLRGIVAAPLVFALSVATIAAAVLMLCAYLLVVLNVRTVLASYGDDLSLVAFLPVASVPSQQRERLADALAALPGVSGVSWISADRALERLRQDLGPDAGVLSGLGANPLPASFEIALAERSRTAAAMRELQSQIEALPGVEDVRFGEAWIESYQRLLRGLEWVGLGLGTCLLGVLGVIVAGTVRLSVHTRADEIQIQRLVGADGFFVRLPLYLEAALQGALGAGLALAALYSLHALGLPLVRETAERVLGISSLTFFTGAQAGVLISFGAGLSVAAAVLSLLRLEEQP